MPVLIFFAVLDLKQKSSFLDRHELDCIQKEQRVYFLKKFCITNNNI
jgi:hypothetical protein